MKRGEGVRKEEREMRMDGIIRRRKEMRKAGRDVEEGDEEGGDEEGGDKEG